MDQHRWTVEAGTIRFHMPDVTDCRNGEEDPNVNASDILEILAEHGADVDDDTWNGMPLSLLAEILAENLRQTDDSDDGIDDDIDDAIDDLYACDDLDDDGFDVERTENGYAGGVFHADGRGWHPALTGYGTTHNHPLACVWWFTSDTCDRVTCNCGPITLLEALSRLHADQRGEAVKAHANQMRELYEHFWSGQGIVSGASMTIGDACPSCISDGTRHVWSVYENACILAEEFGEALAAYAYELFVGEPRYNPGNGIIEEA